MGIRFFCPNGHKLNVKEFQAGRRGICPYCGTKILIPLESTRGKGAARRQQQAVANGAALDNGALESIAAGQLGMQSPAALPTAWPTMTPEAADPFASKPTPVLSPQPISIPSVQPMAAATAAQPLTPIAAQPVVPIATHQAAAQPIVQPLTQPVVVPPAVTAAPVKPDPLADAGNVVWYVRPSAGGQFGPASSEVMRAWITEGRVAGDALVWREGWRDWQQAGEVFPQLQSGASGIDVASIVPPAPSARPASPIYREVMHQQTRNTQALIITALVLIVVLLFGIFLWVILGSGSQTPPAAAKVSAGSIEHVMVDVFGRSLLS